MEKVTKDGLEACGRWSSQAGVDVGVQGRRCLHRALMAYTAWRMEKWSNIAVRFSTARNLQQIRPLGPNHLDLVHSEM